MQGFIPASQREEQVQTLRAYRNLTPSALDALAAFGDQYREPSDENQQGWAKDLHRLGLLDRSRRDPVYRYKRTQRGLNVLNLAKYSREANLQPGGSLRVEDIRNRHKPSNVHARQMIDEFLTGKQHFSPSGMTCAVLMNFAEEAGVDYDLKVRQGIGYVIQRVPFAKDEEEHFKLDRS